MYLDFQVVIERQLGQSSRLSAYSTINRVVEVGIVDIFACDSVEIGAGDLLVEFRIVGEADMGGEHMADGFQLAFLKLIHEIHLGGQLGADTEVVQGVKTAFEHIIDSWYGVVFYSVGAENTLVALQIPFLGEVHRGVPVDQLGDFDRDSEGNVMAHANSDVFPRLFFEKEGVVGVDLRGDVR